MNRRRKINRGLLLVVLFLFACCWIVSISDNDINRVVTSVKTWFKERWEGLKNLVLEKPFRDQGIELDWGKEGKKEVSDGLVRVTR